MLNAPPVIVGICSGLKVCWIGPETSLRGVRSLGASCANPVTVNATGSAMATVRQSGLCLEFANLIVRMLLNIQDWDPCEPRQKARRRLEEHPTSQGKGILISRQAGCKFLLCCDFFLLTMRQSHLGLTKSRRISNSPTVVRRDFVGLTSFETMVGYLLSGARAEVHLMDLLRYN